MMTAVTNLICLLCLLQQVVHAVKGKCKFPSEWKGQYFQSGLGKLIIRDNLITTKGSCIDQNRDYFLIDNREHQCYQCMLMISRHPNIIQYKESFCLIPESLNKVCGQIHVETPLYTLVRDPAISIPCPFEYAYYFNYNDHQNGFCGQPISYAKPCVGHTKYLLHFKHCVDAAIWNGKDLDFECLATWKDGSESYLYSRLTASNVNIGLKDDPYRCLKYLYYGNEVYLSMSADATCRGLRSSTDGPFVMAFTRDEFRWPSSDCEFPDWLKEVTWRNLNGKVVFSFFEKGSLIHQFSRRRLTSLKQLQSEFRCAKITGSREPEVQIDVYSFATRGCMSDQQCLRFVQRTKNVIEFQAISVDHSPQFECQFTDDAPKTSTNQVLVPEGQTVIGCPEFELYGTSSSGVGCVYNMRNACNNNSAFSDASLPCQNNTKGVWSCLYAWTEDDQVLIFAKFSPGSPPLRNLNCSSYKPDNKSSVDSYYPRSDLEKKFISLSLARIGNSDIFSSVPVTRTTDRTTTTSTATTTRNMTPSSSKTTTTTLTPGTATSNSSALLQRRATTTVMINSNEGNEVFEVDEYDDDDEDYPYEVNSSSQQKSAVLTRVDHQQIDNDDDDDDDYDNVVESGHSEPDATLSVEGNDFSGSVKTQGTSVQSRGRQVNIYDSDSSHTSSSPQPLSEGDFQFAFIFSKEGGGKKGGGTAGGRVDLPPGNDYESASVVAPARSASRSPYTGVHGDSNRASKSLTQLRSRGSCTRQPTSLQYWRLSFVVILSLLSSLYRFFEFRDYEVLLYSIVHS